jgi:hypothetical protein
MMYGILMNIRRIKMMVVWNQDICPILNNTLANLELAMEDCLSA